MANSAGYKMYASYLGSNVITVGLEDSVFQYTDIASAVAVAKEGDLIRVFPGTYTVTTPITVNKSIAIEGMGPHGAVVITSAQTTNTMSLNVPASFSSEVTIALKNLSLKHSNAGAGDTLNIDNNGGAAQDLSVLLEGCSLAVTGTGYALNVVHTTGTKDINVSVMGSKLVHSIGKAYWSGKKALSALSFDNVYLTSDITVPAGNAVASTLSIIGCIIVGAAVTTGGNAANIVNYAYNLKATAYMKAALANSAAGDFDALGTEYIGVLA